MRVLVLTILWLLLTSVLLRLLGLRFVGYPIEVRLTRSTELMRIVLHGALAIWCAWVLWL